MTHSNNFFHGTNFWNPLAISKPIRVNSLTGNWTLSSMSDEEGMLYMNAEYTYQIKSNGKLKITKFCNEQMMISHGKVLVNPKDNEVVFHIEGEKLRFDVIKLTPLEMVLKHNSGLEYCFLKNV